MELKLKAAVAADLPRLAVFYRHVIADTPNMAVYTRWKYGLHPRDELIARYIAAGEMFVIEQNGVIVAAVAEARSQDADYHPVQWGEAVADDEAAVLHILGVDPDYQRQGIAAALLEQCTELAVQWGKRALRLDTLAVNTVAQHMYAKNGFTYRGRLMMEAAGAGLIEFLFYEKLL